MPVAGREPVLGPRANQGVDDTRLPDDRQVLRAEHARLHDADHRLLGLGCSCSEVGLVIEAAVPRKDCQARAPQRRGCRRWSGTALPAALQDDDLGLDKVDLDAFHSSSSRSVYS